MCLRRSSIRNIARLYDAGIGSDSQPYLALEYVEGEPIDEYCRTHKLGLEARLAVFGGSVASAGFA